MKLLDLLNDFSALFYPHICVGCGKSLYKEEKYLCLNCLAHLPRTNLHRMANNGLEKRFYGKAEIQHATAFLYFEKATITQKLLHEIKYRGKKEFGEILGVFLGAELRESRFDEIDAIVPVPLHVNRLKNRGYNQSEWIAKGIAHAMEKPLLTNVLRRIIENPTQTQKGVYERWENVSGIFCSENPETVEFKHLLLIDDVITTGATLEACIIPLQKIQGIKISIAALAAVL